MKNRFLASGIVILVLGMLLATAMPTNPGDNGNGRRVIVDTTSLIDKFIFKMKGCVVVHELNDATALECPAGVVVSNAREDRVFQIVDLEADQQIGADDVWDQGIDGSGVNVAVLDTGIDLNHSELWDCYLDGYDFVDDDGIPEDWHGHGTHVSGIITANGFNANAKGVAPGAGIYMYKVCGTYGCYESDMMAAMEAAVETDAKVMSISIGGGNFAGENCDSDPLAAKVNWVAGHGIAVVVSSGNDRFFVSSPACASGAIAVGAVDKDGLMAGFSNFGQSLDIVAPGVSIYSPVMGGYDSWSGTSMSTPHVSGTVALMLDVNPDLTVDGLKTALYETADPVNPDSVCYGVVRQRGNAVWTGVVDCTSDNYGAGIVDAYEAVNYYTSTVVCSSDMECDDSDECTMDICINNGTTSSFCVNTAVADDTLCSGGICCGGVCRAAVCASDLDCDDANECTSDTCLFGGTCSASCGNVWSPCSLVSDGCCGPECNYLVDIDCPGPSCSSCFKGVCDGRCHPAKEDVTCPDCLQ